MKQKIKFLVFIMILIFFISISLNLVYATNIYSDIEYNKIDLGNFNSIVDSEVLSDGSYNLLVYEKEYLSDNGSDSYKYNNTYYIIKYNNKHEEVNRYKITYNKPLTNILSIDESTFVVTSYSTIFIYNTTDRSILELGTDNVNNLKINDIIPTYYDNSLNGFLVVGDARGYHTLPKKTMGVIMKYQDNNLEWVNFINTNEIESTIYSMIQNDRDFIVVGKMNKCIDNPTVPCGSKEIGFASKYDAFGRNIWTKEIDLIPYTISNNNNELVIAGQKVNEYGITNNYLRNVAGIMKLDSKHGNTIWETEYYKKDIKSYGFIISDIVVLNNEIVAVGQINTYGYSNFNSLINKNHLQSYSEYYIRDKIDNIRPSFILKLNSDGVLLNDLILVKNIYYDINITKDNKLLLTGDIYPEEIIHDGYYHRAELYGITSVITNNEINNKIPLSINYPLTIVSSLLIVGIFFFINNNKLRGR